MIIILILIFLILIEIMTFIHELGHFSVAKFSKATVVEFAIGFGPALFQKKVGDTTYSLRVLPFGGYVSVLSDDIVKALEQLKQMDLTPQQAVTLKKQLKGFDEKLDWSEKPTLDKVSAPKKVWFACMGVTMNFFMLWAVLFLTYASAGKKVDTGTMYATPYIKTFTYIGDDEGDGSTIVEKSGLLYTDSKSSRGQALPETNSFDYGEDYYNALIKEIEKDSGNELGPQGKPLDTDLVLTYELNTKIDDPNNKSSETYWKAGSYEFDYLASRSIIDKKEKEVGTSYWLYSENSSHYQENDKKSSVIAFPVAVDYGKGIVPYPEFGVIDEYIPVGFGEAIWRSIADSFVYLGKGFVMIFDFITFGLVIDQDVNHMYIYNRNMHDVDSGLWWGNATFVMIVWMSFLMITFNILPFPPLDGWHVTCYAYEGIKKKQMPQKTTALMFKIGMALFFIAFLGSFIF